MPRHPRPSAERDGIFLAALAEGLSVTAATGRANYVRSVVYVRRAKDQDFAAAWDAALEAGTDALEDEARRRAHDGVEEPVHYKGEVCGTIRRYSDLLLIFLLKARRPDKYRERTSVDHSGTVTLDMLVRASFGVS